MLLFIFITTDTKNKKGDKRNIFTNISFLFIPFAFVVQRKKRKRKKKKKETKRKQCQKKSEDKRRETKENLFPRGKKKFAFVFFLRSEKMPRVGQKQKNMTAKTQDGTTRGERRKNKL